MSRAYRITVNETLRRAIVAGDSVRSRLEILPIASPEETAAILTAELLARGFRDVNGELIRTGDDVSVNVDPCTGEVTVIVSQAGEASLDANRSVIAWDDVGEGLEVAEQRLRGELNQELEKKAAKKTEEMQKETTAKLEKELESLQPELAKIVNKVTREALKLKAKQLGNVVETSEDEASGNLTLKVEV